jgi:hypothetical protein
MASVFMSFIHEEESTATATRSFLKEILGDSIDTFQSSDQNAIYAGEDWMARIFAELKDAKVLLSMLSPTSIARPWINFEAGAAWTRDAKVIPICFGGLKIANLPKPYSSLQGIEIDTRDGAHYMVSSIAHHLGLPIPRKPFFGPKGALALATPDPEAEKLLIGPYNRLLSRLGIDIPS